jgi:hypothetical protein
MRVRVTRQENRRQLVHRYHQLLADLPPRLPLKRITPRAPGTFKSSQRTASAARFIAAVVLPGDDRRAAGPRRDRPPHGVLNWRWIQIAVTSGAFADFQSMQPATNAVWGYVHGYRWADVAGFVRSLRRTGFAGEIRFFCSGVAEEELERFRRAGVRVEHSPYRHRRIKNRWAKAWPLLRLLPARARLGALARVAQVVILRHLLYHRRLLAEGHRYRSVLLADVRDVWFQADPFQAGLGPGIHVFEEEAGRTIGSEPSNSYWVRQAFDDATLQWLLAEPILCSGTILGTAPALAGFLGHFLDCFNHARRIKAAGIDQGVFNYAARTYKGAGLTAHRNGESVVLTMGIMARKDIPCDAAGRVVRPDGSVIPVLHQYDRHPDMAEKLAHHGDLSTADGSSVTSPS